ncbi:XRE family transcriptional regulator [Pseudoalteromonas rubra]|uniref:XRE family transcriptional regulator n=1 Tax=Pseudoalteromonas rubra TaxID=43658 RepID=A0A0F4QIC7_9GAMM|nr:helix-turn-helix transcriptional regulator [Pseudoalteromonas rubra]KJZ07074.1 XRE family transcriptional regulator [Pseudoalteromonas rubra]TMP31628.1 XRE family transcriptional regulator [Pseudoalteromonas rubra]TMP34712.1 XRE family transcriptional regulator [Pseudoalteromonas rubra]
MIDGDDLKAMRKKANISQELMAKKLECDRKTISNYEQGVSDIKSKQLFLWLMLCKIDTKSLLNQIKQVSSTMNSSTKKRLQDDE